MRDHNELPVCEELKTAGTAAINIDDREIRGIANIFRAFGDETRVKILYALLELKELCVCDLSAIINVSVASASHHLKALYQMELIDYDKRGKYVYYKLDDHHVEEILAAAREHRQHTLSPEK